MDRELSMSLVLQHLLEHIKMVKDMKELLPGLMETNILEIIKIIKDGSELDMTKKETSSKNL